MLLEYGANVHTRDNEGQTPLLVHHVFLGLYDSDSHMKLYLDVIRLLLKHGADIDALDNNHATLLHVAA